MQEIVQLEDVPYKQTTVLVYETTFSVMTRLTECSRHVEWRGWSVLSGNFGVCLDGERLPSSLGSVSPVRAMPIVAS